MEENQIVEEIEKNVVEDATMNTYRCREIVIRTGKALELKEPIGVTITGIIDTPLRWLERRNTIIDQEQCYIHVDRESMEIFLTIGEHNQDKDVIGGRLMLSEEFKKFGINMGNYITGMELSDLIRMNRSCFESKTKAMELVTIMRNFKATITTQIEASDDKKGNTAQLRRQTVEGNQPPSFELNIPIFKGMEKQHFTVEIDIDPDTLQATLVSPDAQDLIVEQRDRLIDEVLGSIESICHNIPIIEV